MAPANELPWHALDADAAIERLATDPRRGLGREKLRSRRDRFGRNELPAAPQRALWAVFLRQFRSPLIYLLFGAAAIALALGETKDAIVIFTVVLLNSLIDSGRNTVIDHAG